MEEMFYTCNSLTNIVYGENFIYTEGITIDRIFDNCPANKPTHESWNGLQF